MVAKRSTVSSKVRPHKRYSSHYPDKNREFNWYFIELSRYEPLSSDEEIALAQRIRAGDEGAFKKLVLANLRFVVSVARTYANQGLPMGDLIEAGNIGLMEAARRFDGRRNFRFITYAAWWIRRAIIEELAFQSRAIRFPFNRISDLFKIEKAGEALQNRSRRSVNPAEIAEELSMEEVELAKLMHLSQGALSLDSTLPSGDGTLYDVIPDENDFNEDAQDQPLNHEITSTISSLNKTEKEVVNLYFGIKHGHMHTLKEIGKRLDLSRERIRQIKERAIQKLRQPACSSRLKEYY